MANRAIHMTQCRCKCLRHRKKRKTNQQRRACQCALIEGNGLTFVICCSDFQLYTPSATPDLAKRLVDLYPASDETTLTFFSAYLAWHFPFLCASTAHHFSISNTSSSSVTIENHPCTASILSVSSDAHQRRVPLVQ